MSSATKIGVFILKRLHVATLIGYNANLENSYRENVSELMAKRFTKYEFAFLTMCAKNESSFCNPMEQKWGYILIKKFCKKHKTIARMIFSHNDFYRLYKVYA
ncbi:MAG: hypothetical protein LBI78_07120 [Campylobacteraceae bacterium]|jgi:hypothetical protein|nr:hypothetical protein [Campylobacteraceae bacterium]